MPFGNAFTGTHLIIVLVVILLLFGATKLPALAKSLGQSARIFKGEIRSMKDEDAAAKGDQQPTAQQTPTVNEQREAQPVSRADDAPKS